jgi:tetratricopeptide (TPR) repeat protein
MKKIYISLLFIAFGFTLNAQNLNQYFEQANAAYREAKYDTAIELYEKIISAGKEAPEIYFNLGNAYYRENKVAKSILNYEKALMLAPNDETIKQNLDKANLLVKQKVDPIPKFFLSVFFKSIGNLISVELLTTLSLVFFFLMLVLAAIFVFSGHLSGRKMGLIASLSFFVLFLLSFLFAYHAKQERVTHDYAIVMKPSVDAQSSPDKLGVVIFTLSEGMKVEITDIRQDWVEIKLADGKIAWLSADEIELI